MFPFESSDSLDIDLPAAVSYRPGTKAEATVSGDPAVVNHVHVANGRLRFDDEIGCIPAKHLAVQLTAPPITRWTVNGSGDLVLSGIDQQKLELRIRGSGRIAATGSVQVVALNVAGSGRAQLQELSARSAEIVVHGSGDARVAAQDNLNIAIAGSGVVRLYGRPANVHSTVSGSGRIENAP
jgi:carbon monoxide dehydrogenase subunit G